MTEDYFCKICGRTSYVSEHEWINKSRCRDCRSETNLHKEYLDRKVWGFVCEDYISGMTRWQLCTKYKVKDFIINNIIDLYKGVGEQPLIVTFKVPSELEVVGTPLSIEPFKKGQRVRSKYSLLSFTIKEIIPVRNTFKYKGEFHNQTVLHHNLERVNVIKESVSFNV